MTVSTLIRYYLPAGRKGDGILKDSAVERGHRGPDVLSGSRDILADSGVVNLVRHGGMAFDTYLEPFLRAFRLKNVASIEL